MNRISTIAERVTASRWTAFDDLPAVTRDDIINEISERFNVDSEYDAKANLTGLVKPPMFLVRDMPIRSITEYNRKPSKLAVDKYVKMLESGSEAPPILVDGNRFVDGGHRFAAYVKAGRKTIPAVDVGRLFKLWPEWMEGKAFELERAASKNRNSTIFKYGDKVQFRKSGGIGLTGYVRDVGTGRVLVQWKPNDRQWVRSDELIKLPEQERVGTSENRFGRLANCFLISSVPKGVILLKAGDGFNVRGIRNRRFMYNPRTFEVLFGGSNISTSSHAQEWYDSGAKGNFDDCVRGWIGYGGEYRSGIIHFAPEIRIGQFDAGWDALQMFKRHGATDETVIRNFVKMGEQTLGEILNPAGMQKVASDRFGRIAGRVTDYMEKLLGMIE